MVGINEYNIYSIILMEKYFLLRLDKYNLTVKNKIRKINPTKKSLEYGQNLIQNITFIQVRCAQLGISVKLISFICNLYMRLYFEIYFLDIDYITS